MSDKSEKLSVRFLLNKETEQSSPEERRQRRQSPESASSSSSPSPDSSISLRREASTRRTRRQPSEAASGSSTRTQTAPGSSATHASGPNRHTGTERNFRCELCGKTFVERGNLNKHISSVHRKEKTKVCPEPGCGKSFSFRDGLIRHIAHVHQNERRHACHLCDKTFKQASHLGKHMRSIHKKQ